MGSTKLRESASESRVVRRYTAADRDDVLALDRRVWDRSRTAEWLAWKYENNPYLSDPPVFLAEIDGEVVGARPFLAVRLRIDGEDYCALQPSDTMVHPDFRGRGIFTEMTERAIEAYRDGEPSLCFNFPNAQARPGYLKLGWRHVGDRVTHYRVQRPDALLAVRENTSEVRARVNGLARSLARGYNALHDAASEASREFLVRRIEGVESDLLADCYRRAVPDEIHARRDEQFYRWRFGSPAWNRRTYVAADGSEPVAALLARTRTTASGVTLTQVADAVPMDGGERWRSAVSQLLDAVLDDHRDSDLLSASGGPIPTDLLASRGFHRSDRPPLSWLTDYDRTLVARPLSGPDDRSPVASTDLFSASNWRLSFAERDTA